MTSLRLPALLGLGTAIVAAPAPAVIFTLSATVQNDPSSTYTPGQTIEIVFTLDPNRGIDSSTDSYSDASSNLLHYGEEAGHPAFWSNVTAEGLIGDWEPRATRGGGTDRILTYFNSDQIGLLSSGPLSGGIGFTASGDTVTNFFFVATFTGLDFQDPGSLVDPNTYYADYVGTYALASEDTAQFQLNGGSYLHFDINTLTISAIPEPAAILPLLGLLAGMGVALRRRR